MSELIAEFGRFYSSDAAFTAACLLAFGLIGISSSLWTHLSG